MICCLNAHCRKPLNPDTAKTCRGCGAPLVQALRGRYRPIRLLGQGGFGRTYLAQDQDRLNAKCVIKQFSPQVRSSHAMSKAVSLFNQEAIRLYELGEHPQIPTLLAYFEQDSYLYLVQQYVDGQSLAQELLRQGAFDEAHIRSLLIDLLPILQFVHDHQVIHRDITPMNILRRKSDGRVVLIDFGVAKQLNVDIAAQPGTRIGTEGYSPMEQFRGGRAYPASDLYSLGATCLHLLTNTRPDYLYDPLNGEWIWQSQLNEQQRPISAGLTLILDKMLKDLVNERYQTATDVLNTLQVLERKHPIASIRSPNLSNSNLSNPNLSNPNLSNPNLSNPNLSNPNLSNPNLSNPNPRKPRGSVVSRPSSPSSGPRPSTPQSSASTNPSTRRSGSGTRKRTAASYPPVAITSPPPPGPLPQMRPSSSPPLPPPSRPPVSAPRSANGPKANGAKILRRDASRSSPDQCCCLYTLSAHKSWVTGITVNPVTQIFASSGLDDTVKVWNFQTGDLIFTLKGHTRGVNTVAFSPNGQFLLSGSDDYSVKIWNPVSGQVLRELVGHSRDVTSVVVSADGRYVLSGGADRTIRIWDLYSGRLLKVPLGVASIVRSVAVSADGQVFVSGGLDRKIKLWGMKNAELAREWTAHRAAVTAVTVSANSQMVASAGKDQTIKLWDVQTGKLIREFKGHRREVNAIALSPTNQHLISGGSDGTIRLWDTANGQTIEVIDEHADSVNAIAIHPQGQHFISGSSDRCIKVWQFR